MNIGRAALGNQAVGVIRREISVISVDPDSNLEFRRVRFWMKLRGVYIPAVADHLIWACLGGYEMGRPWRKGLCRLLVADKGIEVIRAVREQWVTAAISCQRAGGRTDRLGVPLFGNLSSEMLGEDSDSVTATKERQIATGDFGHHRHHGSFDSSFVRRL